MFWIFSILSMDSSKPNKALCKQSPCFCHGEKKDLTEVLLINQKWLDDSLEKVLSWYWTLLRYLHLLRHDECVFLCIVVDIGPIHGKF